MSTAQLSDGNLWLHFTRTADWLGPEPTVPVLDHGEGCYVWDTTGKRYLDGLSALFCLQVGYGRQEMVEAAATQMAKLPFSTNWSYANQPSIDLAGALAQRFPGDLNRFFFVNSGSEAVEGAVKLAQQYHRLNGEPTRVKVISRNYAYHGTTLGALGVTGLAGLREPFEPLRPVHLYAPNTNAYRPQHDDPAQAIEDLILEAGPENVSLVIAEPVQNAGGCFTPPADYWPRLREICDRHGVLLACDEVITAFGRLGTWTGAERYGVVPDILTFAKGVTSAYAPLGGVAFRDHIAAALQSEKHTMFVHGATWGGHPVSCAVALANLEVFETEDVLANVQANEDWFGDQLRELYDRHEIVGDVRGTGYFWALELVKDREHKVMFDDAESEDLLRGFLSSRMLELGLILRADDRDEPVLQLSPPLVADRAVLGELVDIVDQVLGEAQKRTENT
ncbi:aspartate aminotransferase family protein [Nitriliruptor alkaliphilus]|uniref:aspartate aminotransferase family protein n=1 Tax=Nitriliruptor alkaliphilus TaxID=427918 RepID=UPI00069868BC|nr:aspartate aminotransferase family protein [Nitriliruptor alkaliphilus]